MPTEMLTKEAQRASERPPLPSTRPAEVVETDEEPRVAAARQRKRVRRLKIHALAWGLGTVAITTLWVVDQWQENGAFHHFGSHSGNPGDWNPTLWALPVGLWGLFVGLLALRVHFERPPTGSEIEREAERLRRAGEPSDVRRHLARKRLEQLGRLRFQVAAWALGMVVLTPLWALIEWQDNGGLDRFSADSQPGSWEPWILYVAGIWAGAVALFALRVLFERRASGAETGREDRLVAFFAGLAEARAGTPPRTGRARRTFLTWRDLAGTLVALLVVLVYVANVQDWGYLESNRWAAVTMVAIGAFACPVGARVVGEKASAPLVGLGVAGVAALVLAVLAIVTAAQWALLALAVVLVALWAGTTLRHGLTPPPAAVAR